MVGCEPMVCQNSALATACLTPQVHSWVSQGLYDLPRQASRDACAQGAPPFVVRRMPFVSGMG